MATLEKIRSKAGLLVIVVGLALFAFIIGDFLNSGTAYWRHSQEKIAVIEGIPVNIQEYQKKVDEMTEMYKSQTGMTNIPEEYASQIRQTVFDTMVREIVLGEETSKLGMEVTPEELFDMVQGNNISPVIQQMGMFKNPQTGAFDKTQLLNFLKAINDDASAVSGEQAAQLQQAKDFWLFWEKNMKQQRLEEKFATLLSKAVSANNIDALDAFEASSNNADIAYVMQSYSTIADSSVVVTDAEIEKLYNQRKEAFKQAEGRVVSYIAVDIAPSQEDFDKVSSDMESVKTELTAAGAADVADVVNDNSDIPFLDAYLAGGSMDAEMKNFVQNANEGETYGPVFENNTYKMFKLVSKVSAPDSVLVSQILIPNMGDEKRAAQLADSLKTVLKGGANFADIAKQYSADGAAQNGGELGWFTEAGALQAVDNNFKNAIFNAPLNEVVDMKTMYGTHLLKVTKKTANVDKYKVANLQMTVSPSSRTYSGLYNDLNQFVAKNGSSDKMEGAASEAGYTFMKNVPVTGADQTLGAAKNSRQVIRWAFGADKGTVSEIFEADNQFIVAIVEGKVKEGYKPVKSVAPMLKAELVAQKKGEMIIAELAKKSCTSLDQYANAMGSKVDSVKFVGFDTRRITNIGFEPKINAAVAGATQGKLSAPIAGNNGVYVVQITAVNKDAQPYDAAAEKATLNASNAYRLSFQAVQELINNAEIEDNRVRFY
ncbi:MAG: SurA N-terminal domain-containing protein [Tannerellaceae bacterium]